MAFYYKIYPKCPKFEHSNCIVRFADTNFRPIAEQNHLDFGQNCIWTKIAPEPKWSVSGFQHSTVILEILIVYSRLMATLQFGMLNLIKVQLQFWTSTDLKFRLSPMQRTRYLQDFCGVFSYINFFLTVNVWKPNFCELRFQTPLLFVWKPNCFKTKQLLSVWNLRLMRLGLTKRNVDDSDSKLADFDRWFWSDSKSNDGFDLFSLSIYLRLKSIYFRLKDRKRPSKFRFFNRKWRFISKMRFILKTTNYIANNDQNRQISIKFNQFWIQIKLLSI